MDKTESQEDREREIPRDKKRPREDENGEETKKMDTFNCSIDKFLEDIPDPIAEFTSDHYPRNLYERNAEIYLTSRYQNLDPEMMKQKLQTNKYNLTTVTADLEAEGYVANPYSLDKVNLHHPPSIYFHQEVWFIEHRREILDFLDSSIKVANTELNNVLTCPSSEQLFECEICSEDVVDYLDLGTCNKPNGHLFCKTCIRRNIEMKIGEGSTTFPCLTNCDGYIDLQTIEEILPPETFSILMNKIQEEEVRSANVSGVETCPFCHYAYGPGDESLFNCMHPNCMKKSCRVCRKEDHSPNLCQMFQDENEEKARHYVENIMTETLVRKCYKCGKGFIKESGCNMIACICGAVMCYMCCQPITSHSHFNDGKCKANSDEITLHVQPVADSALRAFDQIIANNPGINLDSEGAYHTAIVCLLPCALVLCTCLLKIIDYANKIVCYLI